MAISTDTPHGRIFERLALQLHNRRVGRDGSHVWNPTLLRNKVERPGLDLLDDYMRSDPPLRSDMHSDWKPYMRAILRAGRYNIAEKTVVSTSDLMGLVAFSTNAANDEFGDSAADMVMKNNEMTVVSCNVHDWMLEFGDAYTLTQPRGKYGWTTAEDPRQTITSHDALTGQITGGLKLYRDEWDSADFAYLALRMKDGSVKVQKFKHEGRSIITSGTFRLDPDGWELDGDEQTSPNGMMPFERFTNRFGVGEFERHLSTLDRINDKVFNEWWISKIQAFRQRAVKNLPETEKKNVDGKVVEVEVDYTDMFTAAPDAMWQVPEGVDFWESNPIDLTPITASVQRDLERYAAAVDMPLFQITPDAAQGSAEGASLQREGRTFKVEDRVMRVKRKWAAVMAKHFAFSDDPDYQKRADVTAIETHFAPVERYSLHQRASAASQLKGIYPSEAIWVDVLQKSPADVPRLRSLRGADRLYDLAPTFQAPSGGQ